MIHFGDKHSRYSIKASYTVPYATEANTSNGLKRSTITLRTSMSLAAHRRQHYTKAMEKRNTTTEFILCRYYPIPSPVK
jgi:hypothetical protein